VEQTGAGAPQPLRVATTAQWPWWLHVVWHRHKGDGARNLSAPVGGAKAAAAANGWSLAGDAAAGGASADAAAEAARIVSPPFVAWLPRPHRRGGRTCTRIAHLRQRVPCRIHVRRPMAQRAAAARPRTSRRRLLPRFNPNLPPPPLNRNCQSGGRRHRRTAAAAARDTAPAASDGGRSGFIGPDLLSACCFSLALALLGRLKGARSQAFRCAWCLETPTPRNASLGCLLTGSGFVFRLYKHISLS